MAGANRITRSVAPKSLFESALAVIDATVSINQGDLVVFDDTNNRLKKAAAEAEGSTFLGIMRDTIVLGKLAKVYSTDVDTSSAITDVGGPLYGVIAKLVLKSGDTLAPGDDVFLDPANGTFHVSSTGTKSIGIHVGASITGDGVKRVEIHLGCRAKNDVLKF